MAIRGGAAAKWLNEQGYRLKCNKEGGGPKRHGYFTVDNLQAMLRNKIYIGVRNFRQKGEVKETEAVWPPIVGRDEFEQANAILSKNKSCNKNAMVSRYPYILSGFVWCKVCGDRLLGKSAHGKYEKYGYYEHSINTKKGAVVPGLRHHCDPRRIRATDIEPLVWNAIVELMTNEKVAGELLTEATKSHRRNPGSKEAERCRHTVFSVDQQLENLAERLSSLPATIAPTPIFRQMEKLEGIKSAAQSKLSQLDQAGATVDAPAELKYYRLFLATLREILRGSDCPKTKTYIVRQLIKSIQVSPEAVFINFMTGTSYVQQFLRREAGQTDDLKAISEAENKKGTDDNFVGPLSPDFLRVGSSNSLTIGRPPLGKGHLLSPTSYVIDSVCISELPKYQDLSFLRQKYVTENLSAKEIALLSGCSPTAVKKYLKRFGISIGISKGGPGSSLHREKLAFGKKIVGHSLQSHKGEIQVIESIKQMYRTDGLGPVAIARIMNTMKVPTKRQGKKWDHSVIKAILEREGIYKQTRKSPRKDG